MDEDLVASLLLLTTALLWVLSRYGIVSPLLLRDIWPAVLIITGLFYLYLYFSKLKNLEE